MAVFFGGLVISHLRQNLLNKRILTQLPSTSCIQVRGRKNNKHWNPEFKKERRQKVIKIDLPDFEEMHHKDRLTIEEMQSKMKEKGVAPPRPWMEKPIFVSCSGGLFECYVPQEGDGKMTVLSKKGALQRMQQLEKKGQSMMAIRKVRSFNEEFELSDFAQQAQQIYIDTHKALCNMDKDRLHDLVTEHCYPDLIYNVKFKTLRWQFLKSLEHPHVVHVHVESLIAKENMIAQITVRFHTQQTLAVYDRFGRLMHGSEVLPKDVLEYVVFEKHLSNLYGSWRIHAKIIPNWLPPREPPFKTYFKVADDRQEEEPTHKVTPMPAQPMDALSTV